MPARLRLVPDTARELLCAAAAGQDVQSVQSVPAILNRMWFLLCAYDILNNIYPYNKKEEGKAYENKDAHKPGRQLPGVHT